MDLVLSEDAEGILAKIRAAGSLATAPSIIRAPLPRPQWWRIVSDGARSGDPYPDTVRKLIVAQLAEPEMPAWPPGMYEIEESLPAITQDEALAVIERFLVAESQGIRAGVQLYTLHWDVLASHYCPLRERYRSLAELCAAGVLLPSTGGALHLESNLRWPLVVSESAVERIRRLRIGARLPTLQRVEHYVHDLSRSFPILTKAVTWLIAGGGVVKLVEWLYGSFVN